MKNQIKQKIRLKASPKEIYETILDSRKHSQFTEAPAFCSKKPGGEFSAYNGMIGGRNLELISNKKIVQAWRAKDWPKGQYSLITFKLTKDGSTCILDFSHTALPNGSLDKIKKGWNEHYWFKLKSFCKNKNEKLLKTKRRKAA